MSKRALCWSSVFCFLVAAACGNDAATRPARLGDPCDSRSCEAGLYCALGGDLVGRCTADCEANAFCESHYGPAARCYALTHCARECSTDGECEPGWCAPLTSGYSVCLSGDRPSTPGAGGQLGRGGSGPGRAGASSFAGTLGFAGTGSGGRGFSFAGASSGGTGGSGETAPCVSNEDCANTPGQYCCVELGSLVCTPRPCHLAIGDPCFTHEQCDSGYCDPAPGECRQVPGKLGAVCEAGADCVSGICCAQGGATQKVCSEACPVRTGDACGTEVECEDGFCVQSPGLSSDGYCSIGCPVGGCGASSSERANVCIPLNPGSSPASACKPGCDVNADCRAIHPDLSCWETERGTRACDFTTSSWNLAFL